LDKIQLQPIKKVSTKNPGISKQAIRLNKTALANNAVPDYGTAL